MMTTAPEEDPSIAPAPGSQAAGSAAAEPVAQVVRRRGQERGQKRIRRARHRTTGWLFATTALFAVLLVGLGYVGYRASLKITGGTSAVTDPNAPGYLAEVQPTPVDLVVVSAEDGSLAGVLIVTAGEGGAGGTVVPVPADLSTSTPADPAGVTLNRSFSEEGLEAVRQRLGAAVGFGFTSAIEVPASAVEDLVAQLGPITVENVDNLVAPTTDLEQIPAAGANGDGTGEVRYPAGELTLEPEQVVEYLAFEGGGEPIGNQQLRHQAVWTAILEGLRAKDLGAQPSTSEGGDLTNLLLSLLEGEVSYDALPTTEVHVPGTYFKVTVPDPAQLPGFTARVIPAPIAAYPGQRARVRILNGTPDPDAAALVAPKVVAGGGMIAAMGNAESFEVTTSAVEYHAAEARPAAESIAEELGLTATQSNSSEGGVDVTVVVGLDRAS